MPEKPKQKDKLATLSVVVCALALGVPAAATLIDLEVSFFPSVPLQDPSAVSQGPHIALFAAAFLGIITSVIVSLGAVVLRHVSPKNTIVGLASFGMAVGNQVAQLVILALVYISNSVNPVRNSMNDVKIVDGQYDTTGKTFTRETFSCTLAKLYDVRETWAFDTCSNLHYARYCLILLSVGAFLIVAIAYWPIRNYFFSRGQQSKGR